jgi:hypothetical protein
MTVTLLPLRLVSSPPPPELLQPGGRERDGGEWNQ